MLNPGRYVFDNGYAMRFSRIEEDSVTATVREVWNATSEDGRSFPFAVAIARKDKPSTRWEVIEDFKLALRHRARRFVSL